MRLSNDDFRKACSLLCTIFIAALATILNAQHELSLKIQLENNTIDFDEPFSVILTNESMQPVRIPNPNFPKGAYQLSFVMVDEETGAHYSIQKSIVSEKYWNQHFYGHEPESPTVEIPVDDFLIVTVCYMDQDYEGDKRLWNNLPDPNTGCQFQITARFDTMQVLHDSNVDDCWQGQIESEPTATELTFTRLSTPKDYLDNDFPEKVLELLRSDSEWTGKPEKDKDSLVQTAANNGHVQVVEWLLDNGADVNKAIYWSEIPVQPSNLEVAKAVLGRNPDLSTSNRGLSSVRDMAKRVIWARSDEEQQICKAVANMYLAAGADCDLELAIYLDDLEQFKSIVRRDLKPAHLARIQELLGMAANLGRLDICKFLIDDYQARVEEDGFMMVANAVAYPEVVQLLVDNGAQLNGFVQFAIRGNGIVDEHITLLHWAAETGKPDTIRLLIEHGLDMFALTNCEDAVTQKPYTPIENAASAGSLGNLLAFLDHPNFENAEEVFRNDLLTRCLYEAVYAWSQDGPQIVNVLIERGANPNGFDNQWTPIQIVVSNLDPYTMENAELYTIIEALLKGGADLDFVSAAAIGDERTVAGILNEHPEMANAKGSGGTPVLHHAVEMDHPHVVRALLNAGCEIDSRCEAGKTALHRAACFGRIEIAEILLKSGADVNARQQGGATPLHLATWSGNLKTIRLLLGGGADWRVRDENGHSAQAGCESPQINKVFSDFKNGR